MLMLGFSSGLPFFLTGNTLGYWMRDEGKDAQRDRVSVMGRSCLLVQVPVGANHRSGGCTRGSVTWAGVADGWSSASFCRHRAGGDLLAGTRAGLATLGLLALAVAFSSSTQDIVVDAWRIEAATNSDELGLLSAAYQFGYRCAMLGHRRADPDRGEPFGLAHLYAAMAVLMAVGVCASLLGH